MFKLNRNKTEKMLSCDMANIRSCLYTQMLFSFMAAPVAERLRALFLNHSIISLPCLVWVRAPHWPRDMPSFACGCARYFFFLWVLPFLPHLLIGPSHMSCKNLERNIKLN